MRVIINNEEDQDQYTTMASVPYGISYAYIGNERTKVLLMKMARGGYNIVIGINLSWPDQGDLRAWHESTADYDNTKVFNLRAASIKCIDVNVGQLIEDSEI